MIEFLAHDEDAEMTFERFSTLIGVEQLGVWQMPQPGELWGFRQECWGHHVMLTLALSDELPEGLPRGVHLKLAALAGRDWLPSHLVIATELSTLRTGYFGLWQSRPELLLGNVGKLGDSQPE